MSRRGRANGSRRRSQPSLRRLGFVGRQAGRVLDDGGLPSGVDVLLNITFSIPLDRWRGRGHDEPPGRSSLGLYSADSSAAIRSCWTAWYDTTPAWHLAWLAAQPAADRHLTWRDAPQAAVAALGHCVALPFSVRGRNRRDSLHPGARYHPPLRARAPARRAVTSPGGMAKLAVFSLGIQLTIFLLNKCLPIPSTRRALPSLAAYLHALPVLCPLSCHLSCGNTHTASLPFNAWHTQPPALSQTRRADRRQISRGAPVRRQL